MRRESIFEICRTRTHKDPRIKLKDLTERVLKDLCPPMGSEIFPKDRVDMVTVAAFGPPGIRERPRSWNRSAITSRRSTGRR